VTKSQVSAVTPEDIDRMPGLLSVSVPARLYVTTEPSSTNAPPRSVYVRYFRPAFIASGVSS
jgi:hypothetical protein